MGNRSGFCRFPEGGVRPADFSKTYKDFVSRFGDRPKLRVRFVRWGSRGLTSTVESSQFNCPQCATTRPCSLKQVRNFFTLYFIPLIPLNVAGRYVECGSCGGTFAEEAMSFDPEKEREETQTQLLRVMVMAALADGHVDDAEQAEIKKQYMELAGLPIPEAMLENEIAMANSSGANLNTYVSNIASSLSPHGKALVVKLAYHTMSAAGNNVQDIMLRPNSIVATPQQCHHKEVITQAAPALDQMANSQRLFKLWQFGQKFAHVVVRSKNAVVKQACDAYGSEGLRK